MRLVTLTAADADALRGLLTEPSLREWLRASDVEQLRARFAGWESRRSPDGRARWLNWLVRCSATDRPLGWVQATVIGSRASVAYAVLPCERGGGAAAAALRALAGWLPGRFGVTILSADIAEANVASQRVARAAGLRPTDRRAGDEQTWERAI